MLKILLIFIPLYHFALTSAQVRYRCLPFNPSDECETSLYSISLFSYSFYRYPIGKAQVHCVVKKNENLLEAENGYMEIFEEKTDDGLRIEFFEKWAFPVEYTKVCRWQ